MSTDPWIGAPAIGEPGTCTFAGDPDEPKCGAPATVHILSESAIDGLVSLPTCDKHVSIGRAAGHYIAEHPFGPGCAAMPAFWGDEGCRSKPAVTDTEAPGMDEWLDARGAWINEGIASGFLASEVRCATHDGDPLTPAEELVFEEGIDDPCIPIVRLANEPGEHFIPRFGP